MQFLTIYVVALLFATCITAYAGEPKISAGEHHDLAITDYGAVYWWGQDYGLHFHLGKPVPVQPPTLVTGLPRIREVAAAMWHSVALGEDGTVFEWGFSPYQKYVILTKESTLGACESARQGWSLDKKDPCADEEEARTAKMYLEQPIAIPGIPAASAIAATEYVTVALGRDGNVYCWGFGAPPQRIPGLQEITAIRLGQFHGVALRRDAAVLTWGSNVNGALGRAIADSSYAAESICGNPQPQIVFAGAIAIGAGPENSYALRADGSVWGWGSNRELFGVAKVGDNSKVDSPLLIATIPQVTQIAGGFLHVIARDTYGNAFAWGSNVNNSIWPGDSALLSTTPVPLSGLNDISEISARDHDIALTRDGYVCAWGDNWHGTARPDSMLRTVRAPVPVMLADGKTPLKLRGYSIPTANEPSKICGIENWRDRVATWEDAIKKQKQHFKLLRRRPN